MSPLLASIPCMVSYLERTVCLDWTCMQVLILLSKILRDRFTMGPTLLWNCNDCSRYFSDLIRQMFKNLKMSYEILCLQGFKCDIRTYLASLYGEIYVVKILKDKFKHSCQSASKSKRWVKRNKFLIFSLHLSFKIFEFQQKFAPNIIWLNW